MRTTWNFFSAGQLTFGTAAASQLGKLTGRLGVGRVLVVSDQVLGELGLLARVCEPLVAAGMTVEVFDEGEAEPTLEVVAKAVELALRFQPDAVLGVGGGSNMDLAKMTATLYTHGGKPEDYFSFDNIPGPVLPIVCVPTTAGTGSEVSSAAVFTDVANQIKVSTLSQYIRPNLAVVDPELTYSCPAKVTADSGIDALTHAIEAYTAIDYSALDVVPGDPVAYEGAHPLGDVLAERAIALVGRFLVRSVADPEDHEARDGMALAATLAGMAFSNCGVALVHALEYPLGGALHCSHGAGNGLLLPYVMEYNLTERIDKLARVAELLGADCAGCTPEQSAREAIEMVRRLRLEIGVPDRIREIGGTLEQLPQFASKSFEIKRLMTINPRTPSEADLLEILQTAL